MRNRFIALGMCICAALNLSSGYAGTVVVTTTADSGAGSFRNALDTAGSGDTIQFDPALNGQTITLTTAELLIFKNLTITGPAPNLLTVKRSTVPGTPAFRIFEITAGHVVTISGLTISNGIAVDLVPNHQGGAIYNNGSTLTIANTTISGNFSVNGGGICTTNAVEGGTASLTVNNSTISQSSADVGGGIFGSAHDSGSVTVTINNSTISGNSANSAGGGVELEGQTSGHAMLTISSSTLSNNSTQRFGGAVATGGFNSGGNAVATISNCTISGNSADLGGSGVSNYADTGTGLLTIINSTIAANSQGPGHSIHNSHKAALHLANTILSSAGDNIFNDSGIVISHGYNLSSDSGSGFLTGPGDLINANPMLGQLQYNGGPTHTHALLDGSAAIDAGDPGFAPPPSYDQRGPGFARVFDNRIDMGSYEMQPVIPSPTPTPTATSTPTATATPTAPTKLLNISTRLRVLTGDNVLIGGFIVTANPSAPSAGPNGASKRVIVRAIGPSLANAGVPGALPDPILELHGPKGFVTLTNDNWRDNQEAEIEATGVAPTDNLESALVATLPPGAYTAVVSGTNNGIGVGLIEAYDLDASADVQLANISTRGFVESGDNVMIGGFILGSGSANARVLIRAIGPSLTASGVPDALTDPTLELHNSNGGTIALNDNWRDTQEAVIAATGIPPSDDREAAIVATLLPGAYTAIVRGKDSATGVALVEAYQLASVSTPAPTPSPTSTPTATATSTPGPTATATPTATASPTPSPTPTASGPAKFTSLSTRAVVGSNDAIMMNAFIISGSNPKNMIVRGLGPSLTQVGIPEVLPDPALDLRSADGTLIRSDDNWRDDPVQEALIIASGMPPPNDLEAAIVEPLGSGSYTVVLRGNAGTTGHGQNDLTDLSPTASRVTAVGTRASVLTGADVMLSFVALQQGGEIVIRSLGPSLAQAGITNPLANPSLELRDGTNGTLLLSNNDWQDDPAQAAMIVAAGLAPSDPLESALIANLAPGTYLTVTAGINNATGIGYVQFYTLPYSGQPLELTP